MINASKIIGILLAGGRSRRMFAKTGGGTSDGGGTATGTATGDKGLLQISGKPMIQHIADLVAPQVHALAINANGDPSRFAALGLPVFMDTIPGHVGPLAGVLAGMRWTAENAPDASHILTAPTDAPLLPTDLRARLQDALLDTGNDTGNDTGSSRDHGRIAIAASGGHAHPVVGLWPVDLADDLDSALRTGVRKVRQWTDRHGTHVVPFPFINCDGVEIDPFFNANTQEDLERLRLLIESSQ